MSMNNRERESSEAACEHGASPKINRDIALEAMWPHEPLDVENYIGTQRTPVPRAHLRECVKVGYEALIKYGTQGAGACTATPRFLEYAEEDQITPALLYACDTLAWTSYQRIPSVSLAFWVGARFYALLCLQMYGWMFPLLPKKDVDYCALIPHESFVDAASYLRLFLNDEGIYEIDREDMRFAAMLHEYEWVL